MVECKLDDDNDPTLKIILSQKALTHDEFFALDEEKIKLTDLKNVLELLEYQDIIPNHMNLRYIDSIESLIKHVIVPFVGISIDAEKNKKIEIWKNAPSLLKGLPEIRFLNEDCYLSLHHVSNTDFRVVLPRISGEGSIRFDFSLDEGSFAKYFEWMASIKPLANPIEDLMILINVAEDAESTAEELQQIVQLVKKYQDTDSVDLELSSCQIRENDKEEELFGFIKKAIMQIEALFIEKNLNKFAEASKMISAFKYYKLRVFDEFKHANFSMLVENNQKKGINVCLKNLYETHAPKMKKIKAEGNFFCSFESVWKDFALSYDRLNHDDKHSVYAMIAECYKLQTHDKPLEYEDYEMYEENPIVHIPVDHGPFSRIFKGESYKSPVISELVGIRGHPIGVKSYLYDCYERVENGVFFYLNPQLWKLKEGSNIKKVIKRHIFALPMKDQYNLESVLKSKGFEIISRQLVFNETQFTCELAGVRSSVGVVQTESLEKILSFNNFIKLFKETNEAGFLEL